MHVMSRRKIAATLATLVVYAWQTIGASGLSNPYLAKPAEAPMKVRIGTCAVTGGFIHLYTALDNRLFDKYGISAEHVVVRGGNVAMAALASDEISFLYCNADANIARIGAGADGKLVAALLIGLPYVVLARKDIKRPADLKGKSIGVTRPGDFTYRLAKEFLKKFNLNEKEVTLAPVGGTPAERYAALTQDVFQATLIQPPLDARGRKDGFNVIYRLTDLGFPFIYSSLFTNSRSLRERPEMVQKAVAALAESIYFVEKNPQLAMNAVGRTLRITDADTLRSAYETYARDLINRRMRVPAKMVNDTLELARQDGAMIRRKPNEIFNNSFVEQLEKNGFLKELWGGTVPEGGIRQ
ncbi:MAG TPA: ABC transporter substrate-binding protein [Candidatus Binatia bacterium]|nr:ABC transporter substrate-binding protein [Candidatus Binatia bacterium]